MKIVFLGTGGSLPSPDRNVAAIALKMNGEVILFDCGEGTQRQFMLSSLSFMQISRVLISHFHGDHFLGLSGLIQSMSLNGRKEPLSIYGPEKTEMMIKILLRLGYFNPTFEVIIYELKDGDKVECKDYDIKVKEVKHNVPTLAFCVEEHPRSGKFNLAKAKELGIPKGPLFRKLQQGKKITVGGKEISPNMVLGPRRKGRKIVYSGDTMPCKAVVELAKDCDVLIHDATFDSSLEEKANEFSHSSSGQAAMVAKEANAKVLFMTHISSRYEDASILEKDARSVFRESYAAYDFLEYDVRYPDN